MLVKSRFLQPKNSKKPELLQNSLDFSGFQKLTPIIYSKIARMKRKFPYFFQFLKEKMIFSLNLHCLKKKNPVQVERGALLAFTAGRVV
ncbi:MAG: hypothetical protein MJY98_10565 [Fibrobacter sp.]|nr:hypothetical protein [Fibrobacter sp.]